MKTLILAAIGGGFGGPNPFGLRYPAREPEEGDGASGGDGMNVGGEALEIDAEDAARHDSPVIDNLKHNNAKQARGATVDQSALHVSARAGAMSDEVDQATSPQGMGEDQQAPEGEQAPQPPAPAQEVQRVAQHFEQRFQQQQQQFNTALQEERQARAQLQQQNNELVQRMGGVVQAVQQRIAGEQRQARMPVRPPAEAPPEEHFRYELAMQQVQSREQLQTMQQKLAGMEQAMKQDAHQRAQQFEQQRIAAEQQAYDAAYSAEIAKVRGARDFQPWLQEQGWTRPDGSKGSRGEVFFNIIHQAYCQDAGRIVPAAAVAAEIQTWLKDVHRAMGNPGSQPAVRQQQQQQQRQAQGQRPTARVVPAGGAPKRSPSPDGQQQGQKTPHADLRRKVFANPYGMPGSDGTERIN